MTCSNCANDAPYVYQVTPVFGIPYCQRHVPKFLLAELKSGRLNKPVVVEEPAPIKTSKKKETPVEEPVIVEEVVEEPVVEETTEPEVTEAE